MTGLQYCYRKGLANDPTLTGKVMLTFRVEADGRVQSQQDMTSQLDGCLSRIMGSWKFSPPSSTADSSYRISLVLKSY